MPFNTLFNRPVKRIGTRHFAIPKPMSLTDRIASATTSGLRGSWDRIADSPVGSTVICNQKSADGRRARRWSKNVTPALFAGRT